MDDEKWKDDMLAALKTIKGKMGYVRTLAKDELEKARNGKKGKKKTSSNGRKTYFKRPANKKAKANRTRK